MRDFFSTYRGHFRSDMLPEAERENAYALSDATRSLRTHVERFQSALALFDWCSTQMPRSPSLENTEQERDTFKLLLGWQSIAMRDAGMSISHFSKALGIVKSLQTSCASFRDRVDIAKLRAARRRFKTSFYKPDDLRNAVAHPERVLGAKGLESHSVTTGYEGPGIKIAAGTKLTIGGSIVSGRRFTITQNGELLSYELSPESLATLAGVRSDVFSAFDDVVVFLNELARARHSQSRQNPPTDVG